MRPPSSLIVAGIALVLSTVAVSAQDSVAGRPARGTGPNRRELVFGATAGSTVVALNGLLTANMVYGLTCQFRPEHSDRGSSFFGPCFVASDEAWAIGWYGGSFAGAAGVAATVAVWRGCPVRDAAWRSIVGAAVGTLPGLLARNTRLSRVPMGRSD